MMNMYNPYGGYGFGGYNPYMQQGGYGGYGSFNPYYGFSNPFMQGGMEVNFGQGFNPYENFFSSFEQKLNELLSNYQTQFGKEKEVGSTTTAPSAGSSSSTASAGNSSTTTTAPAPTTSTSATLPNLGNLGSRLDQGKALTKKAENKLNTLGYSDQQLIQAGQAGGGMAGFQSALGAMTPNTVSAGDVSAKGFGGRNAPRMK